jgi:hypothetical protein
MAGVVADRCSRVLHQQRGEPPVGVDTFWKRVPASTLDGADPEALSSLVPHWFDAGFDIEQREGLLVGVEDTGALIGALLRYGVSDDASNAAATYFESPASWDDAWMVGSIPPAAVGQISDFLAGAPLDIWAQQARSTLAAEAQRFGYQRHFDDRWAANVLDDAQEVARLFHAAAADGQAIIMTISA